MTAAKRTVERKPKRGVARDVAEREAAAQELLLTDAEPLEIAPPPAPEVVPSGTRNVGFVRKGWADFRGTLKEAANWRSLSRTPYGLIPLMVFSLQGVISGFDGQIFGLIIPELVQELNLDVVGMLSALNIVGFVMIFVTLGMAYMLDRWRRVPFVAGGTVVSGLMSMVTPQVRTVNTLALTRIGDSIGATTANIPSTSLLFDYYPVTERGKAIAFFSTVTRAGGLFAPWIVAIIVANVGWRLPFRITGTLLVGVGILMLFALREPIRGYMERRAAGLSDDESREIERPVSYGQAWRTIFAIKTIRRLFVGDVFDGVGGIMFGFVIGLYLFDEYKLDIVERGKLGFAIGVFALFGGFIGGGAVDCTHAATSAAGTGSDRDAVADLVVRRRDPRVVTAVVAAGRLVLGASDSSERCWDRRDSSCPVS